MTENVHTPTKIYTKHATLPKKEVLCRLCCIVTAQNHVTKCFSKSGGKIHLTFKIEQTCDIMVLKDDGMSDAICRKCISFIKKNAWIPLSVPKNKFTSTKCSVKRYVVSLPRKISGEKETF